MSDGMRDYWIQRKEREIIFKAKDAITKICRIRLPNEVFVDDGTGFQRKHIMLGKAEVIEYERPQKSSKRR